MDEEIKTTNVLASVKLKTGFNMVNLSITRPFTLNY